jgi:hypothetical protein
MRLTEIQRTVRKAETEFRKAHDIALKRAYDLMAVYNKAIIDATEGAAREQRKERVHAK